MSTKSQFIITGMNERVSSQNFISIIHYMLIKTMSKRVFGELNRTPLPQRLKHDFRTKGM